MTHLDAVTLHGMSFHTLIGILPHERELQQPLEIDLTVWVPSGADIVDYRELYGKVRGATEMPELFYLEELANTIVARVLEDTAVRRVQVTLRKPHAAVGGPIAYAQVSITRDRDA
ncbi:MAG: dihydroneopterin aldolase [Gemmatimonadaceae bacterium]